MEKIGRRALVGCALLALFVAGLIASIRKGTSELPVYVRAGERMLDGQNIYVPQEDKPFTYPPFFALPFVPLTKVPTTLRRGVWYVANVGMLGLVLMLLVRAMRPFILANAGPRAPPMWLFWLVVAALAARHITAVFENQSHDFVILGAIALTATASMKANELRAGAWAGAGAACKATPLLFAPILAAQRRFAAALAVCVCAAAFTVLPDLLLPQANGQLWVTSWFQTFVAQLTPGDAPEAAGAWAKWNILNQNLAGTIYRLSVPIDRVGPHHFDVSLWRPSETLLRWTTRAALFAVVAFVVFVTRPRASRELPFRRFGETAAVACAMVLLSPMSSKSHFCVLLLPITFCVADFLYRKRDLAVGGLLVFVFVSGTLTAKGIVGRELGNAVLARGSITWTAVACLLATGHILFHRERPRRGAHPAES